MPSGEAWARHWPTDHGFGGDMPDALILCVRSFEATVASQRDRDLVSCRREAEANIVAALLRGLSWAVSHGVAVCPVMYDEIVVRPERFAAVFTWLGVAPVDCPEPIVDGNVGRLG